MKKVLSVILSVAMILSMVACLSFATSADTYTDSLKVEVTGTTQKYVEVTYTAARAFMVALIKFDVDGVTEVIDDEVDPTLKPTVTDPATGFSAGASLINDGAEMRVLVTASDAEDLTLINKVIVKIPVELEDEYTIKPTALQAATSGTDDSDMEDFVNPDFTIKTDDNTDGIIDYNGDVPPTGVDIEEASHTHAYTDHYNHDANYHWGVCSCGAEDTENKVAHTPAYRHTSEGLDEEYCAICGLTLDVDVPCIDEDKDGYCDNCEEEMPSEEPEEPVEGVADLQWNPSGLADSHKVSLSDYSYKVGYNFTKAYYEQNTTVANGTNKTFTITIKGTDSSINLVKSLSPTKSGYVTIKQLGLAALNDDLVWKVCFSYDDANGVRHNDYSAECTINFVDKLTETKSKLSGDTLALTEKFLAFNTAWVEDNDHQVNLKEFTGDDYTDKTVAQWDIKASATVYPRVSFADMSIYLTYNLPSGVWTPIQASAASMTLTIKGATTDFTSAEGALSPLKASGLKFKNISLKRFDEDLTWQFTIYDASGNVLHQSTEFTVNVADTLAASDDSMAVAFTDYNNAWQALYNK